MRHIAAGLILVAAGMGATPVEAHHRGFYDPLCPPSAYVVPPPRVFVPVPVHRGPVYVYPRVVRPHYHAVPPGHARHLYRHFPYPRPRGAVTFYFRF